MAPKIIKFFSCLAGDPDGGGTGIRVARAGVKPAVPFEVFRRFALPPAAWWSGRHRSSTMVFAACVPGVFGPFDGDFDPFEDEEESRVLIPLD